MAGWRTRRAICWTTSRPRPAPGSTPWRSYSIRSRSATFVRPGSVRAGTAGRWVLVVRWCRCGWPDRSVQPGGWRPVTWTRRMPAASGAFEVLLHDVGTEEPPAGLFDLVHAQLVLVHVPQRAAAIASMVGIATWQVAGHRRRRSLQQDANRLKESSKRVRTHAGTAARQRLPPPRYQLGAVAGGRAVLSRPPRNGQVSRSPARPLGTRLVWAGGRWAAGCCRSR